MLAVNLGEKGLTTIKKPRRTKQELKKKQTSKTAAQKKLEEAQKGIADLEARSAGGSTPTSGAAVNGATALNQALSGVPDNLPELKAQLEALRPLLNMVASQPVVSSAGGTPSGGVGADDEAFPEQDAMSDEEAADAAANLEECADILRTRGDEAKAQKMAASAISVRRNARGTVKKSLKKGGGAVGSAVAAAPSG